MKALVTVKMRFMRVRCAGQLVGNPLARLSFAWAVSSATVGQAVVRMALLFANEAKVGESKQCGW